MTWPRDQWVQFWWRSGSPSGSRSLKSEIWIHWIIELLTDFDEILWRAGVWPRDQLITFWWRSASLCGSGSPFWITIRIHPGRTATILLCWRSAEVCAVWVLLVVCAFLIHLFHISCHYSDGFRSSRLYGGSRWQLKWEKTLAVISATYRTKSTIWRTHI